MFSTAQGSRHQAGFAACWHRSLHTPAAYGTHHELCLFEVLPVAAPRQPAFDTAGLPQLRTAHDVLLCHYATA